MIPVKKNNYVTNLNMLLVSKLYHFFLIFKFLCSAFFFFFPLKMTMFDTLPFAIMLLFDSMHLNNSFGSSSFLFLFVFIFKTL